MVVDMTLDLSRFVGFRNLDAEGGIIAAAMESRTLQDHGSSSAPGLIALTWADGSVSDRQLEEAAASLPAGQALWFFGPTRRRIGNARLRETHINHPEKEWRRYVAHFLEKFVKNELPEGTPLTPRRLPFPEARQVVSADAEYVPVVGERAVVTRYVRGVPFEFYADLKEGKRSLVVFGQSAIDRKSNRLPYFSRWTWSHRIDASVLVWNDPTLYLDPDIRAGWWIGTRERDYVAEAVEIIRSVMNALRISPENVLFFGTSAGAFSAFQMATELSGSKVIAENPRVTLRVPGELGREAEHAVKACLGWESALEVPEDLQYRVHWPDRMQRVGNFPEFWFLQNSLDERHVKTQYGPFREEFEKHARFDPERHHFVEYSQWSLLRGGHFPIKEAAMLRIIDGVLKGTFSSPGTLPYEFIVRD